MKTEEIMEILLDYSPFGKKLVFGINRKKYTRKIKRSIWNKLIKILVWFRRSWKSYIFRYLIYYLITRKKIEKENILFINLEDDRLFWNRNVKNLRQIYETYLENMRPKWKIYIFFDEIQVIKWWESFIRTLYEQNNDIEIFLTGSNSDLLSSEISSSLSWRFLEFKIYPLDFKEYLYFHNLNINSKNKYLKNKIEIKSLFNKYLKYWWLPEILEINNEEQIEMYLEWIFNKIVIDDIVKRFNIRNVELIELINKYLITNISWILSYKNIENSIKHYSHNISHTTLTDYINYIKKWFIIYDIWKFDWKIKSIFDTYKKYYVLDLWIREVKKLNSTNDLSKKIENLVFMKLLQDDEKIYYWQDDKQKEIDFITKNKNKFDKYQVISYLNPKNINRELWNFRLSDKYIKWDNFLITIENSEILDYKWTKINKINIIEWLLGI